MAKQHRRRGGQTSSSRGDGLEASIFGQDVIIDPRVRKTINRQIDREIDEAIRDQERLDRGDIVEVDSDDDNDSSEAKGDEDINLDDVEWAIRAYP